jgi:hypothetical protein
MFEQIDSEIVDRLNTIGFTATSDNDIRYHDARNGEILVRGSRNHTMTKSSETYVVTTLVDLFVFGVCSYGAILEHYNVTKVNENSEQVSRELNASGTLEVIKITIEYQTLKSVSCLSC